MLVMTEVKGTMDPLEAGMLEPSGMKAEKATRTFRSAVKETFIVCLF